MIGTYPDSIHALKTKDGQKVGEWRGNGQSIVFGRHPTGLDYQRVVDAPAVEISFDQINWPQGLVLPWKEAKPSPIIYATSHAPSDINAFLDRRIRRYMEAVDPSVADHGGDDQLFHAACILVIRMGSQPRTSATIPAGLQPKMRTTLARGAAPL
jgi:hypothetical protein